MDNVIKFPRLYIKSSVESDDYSNVLFLPNGFINEVAKVQVVEITEEDDDNDCACMF